MITLLHTGCPPRPDVFVTSRKGPRSWPICVLEWEIKSSMAQLRPLARAALFALPPCVLLWLLLLRDLAVG